MLRELKFRVWNQATGKWLNEEAGTHLWSEYGINIFTGKVVEYITGDNEYYSRVDEPNFYFDKTTPIKKSPYVVQQYTGLKDKNGVEIYEGDIVEHWICLGPAGETKIVSEVKITKFGPNLEAWAFGNGLLPEVIGNIFENNKQLEV